MRGKGYFLEMPLSKRFYTCYCIKNYYNKIAGLTVLKKLSCFYFFIYKKIIVFLHSKLFQMMIKMFPGGFAPLLFGKFTENRMLFINHIAF